MTLSDFSTALREFEKLPIRRITRTTVVLERGPLDDWRKACGILIHNSSPEAAQAADSKN